MGLFNRKNKEVIDLTKLHNSGVLQRSREIAQRKEKEISGEDVIDLSSNSALSSGFNSGDSFLSSLAGVGSGNDSGSNEKSESVVDSLRAARFSRSGDVNALKNKIEDIEYKLDRFIERLERIEEKIKD